MLSPYLKKGVFEGQSSGERLLDIKCVVLALGTVGDKGSRWGLRGMTGQIQNKVELVKAWFH